jgi:hypothetical protein
LYTARNAGHPIGGLMPVFAQALKPSRESIEPD